MERFKRRIIQNENLAAGKIIYQKSVYKGILKTPNEGVNLYRGNASKASQNKFSISITKSRSHFTKKNDQ